MTEAVCDVCNKVHILTFLATEQTVNGIDNNLDNIDILPFVETTNIICLGNGSLMENEVDSTSMILNEKPVANILTLTIYRQWFAVTYIIDKERNQLLWELVRTIVV